jgi:hypothetical protein
MCTGLEPLFLAGGATAASAATMATMTGVMGAGMLAGKIMQPKLPKIEPIKESDRPQASKEPDRAGIAAKNAAAAAPGGSMAGNSGTFLTGPSGIDPSTLNLGKNTLLGE